MFSATKVADMRSDNEMWKDLKVEDGLRDPRQLLNSLQSATAMIPWRTTISENPFRILHFALLDEVLVRARVASQISEAFDHWELRTLD